MKGKVTIMAYSIYDSFLTIQDCKYYCNQVANKLNLKTYDYFYDKSCDTKFDGDSNIYNFKVLQSYESWRIRFNLTKPKTIMKLGLDNYISKNKELVFNLTIKGFSFIYVCKFYNDQDIINNSLTSDLNTNNSYTLYVKSNGQLSFIL